MSKNEHKNKPTSNTSKFMDLFRYSYLILSKKITTDKISVILWIFCEILLNLPHLQAHPPINIFFTYKKWLPFLLLIAFLITFLFCIKTESPQTLDLTGFNRGNRIWTCDLTAPSRARYQATPYPATENIISAFTWKSNCFFTFMHFLFFYFFLLLCIFQVAVNRVNSSIFLFDKDHNPLYTYQK